MKSLLQAGATVQRLLEEHHLSFCFIGGVANFRWGTPRLTNDLDLTVFSGFGNEPTVTDLLLSHFDSRVPDARSFAAANRVVLLRTPDGFPIDVALGAMPFEAATIERSSTADLAPGAVLRTCSAEDLVVHKAFAARPQDWADIEGVILRQRGLLDWSLIWSELGELAALKEAPEILDLLERVIGRTESVLGPFSHGR